MNKLTLLLGMLLCVAAVTARHFDRDEPEAEERSEDETLRRPKDHGPSRHRRRRWQMNYGYDYPQPSYPFPDRRDDRNNQEALQNIYRLLDEISSYVRRPPPPPQPIYIPYPVPYGFPHVPKVQCQNKPVDDKKTPNVTNRINSMEDTNQNWGLVVSEENEYDDGSDGSRPISFDPVTPKQYMKRPSPKVEHGSVQASYPSTQAPRFGTSRNTVVPKMCSAAILSCCGYSDDKNVQKNCFTNIGCSMSYENGKACSQDSIQQVLESFKLAYSPA